MTTDAPGSSGADALPEDPALAAAVLEIEGHVAQDGWDQPARLYALVDTATLVAQEPALAAAMAIDGPADDGSFTSIEQEGLPPGQALEEALHTIAWPDSVSGCAAVIERLEGWGWDAGLRPSDDAPTWRMDAFRDTFLASFGPEGETGQGAR